MKRLKLISLSIMSLGLLAVVGCNSRPDPRQNPDFNEKALSNPGGIEMKPINPNQKPK